VLKPNTPILHLFVLLIQRFFLRLLSRLGQQMAEFFNRERAKQFNASLNLLRRFSKLPKLLLVTSRSHGRVGNTPVSHGRLARKDRARFFRPIAYRDDDIESSVFELIPRFAARLASIDPVLFL